MPVAKPVYNDLINVINSLPDDYTSQVIDFARYLKAKAERQAEVMSEGCPICAKLRDPVTGEPLYNNETKAGIKEVDDMLAGKIPNTLKSFNNLEEMLADLDADEDIPGDN
ncbi:MAG: hypothetical protein FWD13_06180 [Treponema sp.]|nr:hypothetical protein [Treponema sp.]